MSELDAGRLDGVSAAVAIEPVTAPRPMARLLTVISGAVFVAGIGLGVVLSGLGSPRTQSSSFPTAATVAEPAAAARVAQAIAHDDAGSLANVDARILQTLDGSLDPIVHVTEVRFLGAVSLDGDTVAAYLVRGKDAQGQATVRGFALHVQEDQVVGVN